MVLHVEAVPGQRVYDLVIHHLIWVIAVVGKDRDAGAVEMLQNCGESYAMENAHDEIKKVAKYIAPSNDDEGVMQVLKKIL